MCCRKTKKGEIVLGGGVAEIGTHNLPRCIFQHFKQIFILIENFLLSSQRISRTLQIRERGILREK